MKDFDPRRIDIEALCAAGAELAGEWPGAGFERLHEGVAPDMAAPTVVPTPVTWSLAGRQLPAAVAPELWLHLRARAGVVQTCQRCLQYFVLAVAIDRRLRFVHGEDDAARLDEESEDDVLALPPQLDLHELLEDELILALPVVPMHEDCPAPLWAAAAAPASATAAAAAAAAPHPFAGLGSWPRAEVPGSADSKPANGGAGAADADAATDGGAAAARSRGGRSGH